MRIERSGGVLRDVHALYRAGTPGGLTDLELLERFRAREGEAAERSFAALVERHGPMVLGICRRILRDPHDADDAFQATFLVLVRKAGTIRSRSSVASWLHGVACRVSIAALASLARRRRLEAALGEAHGGDGSEESPPDRRDEDAALHQELERLPERYRGPLVLCYLEGLSHEEAALRLDRPVATVRTRLARARERLRSRLERRGLAPSAMAAMAARWPEFRGAIAPTLAGRTAVAALGFASRKGPAAGSFSASSAVTALEGEVSRSMTMAKLKGFALAAMVVFAVAAGGAALLGQEGGPAPKGEDARKEILALERAWGEAIVRSDAAALDRILAYEMIGTGSEGERWDKAKYLRLVGSGSHGIESYDLREPRVDVYGDAAVVTGLVVTNADSKRGLPKAGSRFTSTYIRRQGSWQCVAWQCQTSRLGADDAAPAVDRGRQER